MVQCVIVDDPVMVPELLTGIVRTIPGLSVTATATDLVDAERVAALDRGDLLIVDRQRRSGHGMAFARSVVARHPRMKCLVIAGSTIDFVCPPDPMNCIVTVVDTTEACDTLLSAITKAGEAVLPDADRQTSLDGIQSLLIRIALEPRAPPPGPSYCATFLLMA